MVRKYIKIVFLICFGLMITLPLLTMNTKPGQISELENRTLAELPSPINEDGTRNENYSSDFETWYNDNVGLRETLFTLNSRLQYTVFANSALDSVVSGKDGWLFYAKDHNIDIAEGTYPDFNQYMLPPLCERLVTIRDRLAEQGIEYVLVLPPSKVSVYPEYLRGDFSVTVTPADMLADYLEENSDIKVVRLKETLIAEKDNYDEPLFFKTDTHWNALGARVAYLEMNRKMNEWGILEKGPCQAEVVNMGYMHDLTARLLKEDEKYYEYGPTAYDIADSSATEVKEGEIYEALKAYGQAHHQSICHYFVNEDQSLPSFLVFGDSMFRTWLEPLVAEDCSELALVSHYNISQEMIDLIEPDVVIYEMTERNLVQLQYASENFYLGN